MKDLKASLEKDRSLDPYSPRTDYLLAKINLLKGNFDAAMARMDEAIEKMKKYKVFAFTGIGWNDLYERKARIAEELGQWEVAIEYMKKTVPEADQGFLSRVYLEKYLETGAGEDIESSFLHAALVFDGTPRLVLDALKKYSDDGGLLKQGLDFFRNRVKKLDSNRYRLGKNRTLPEFQLKLGTSLLEYWRGSRRALEAALKELKEAKKHANSPEKRALVYAVMSKVYRGTGRTTKEEELERKSIDYFSQYSSLYDNWVVFVRGAGGR